MPKKSAPTKKKTSSTVTSSSTWTSLQQAANTLEQMQALHLILLLFLTVMATVLVMKVIKQEQQIQSLQFRLEFMTSRYHSERAKLSSNMEEDMQEEEGESPAPAKNLQF